MWVPARSRAVRRERIAMRYTKDHKQATRQRIVEAAGRRFKKDGIDGAGVAAVMSDAGLTNGAFYAHFASKEDLVANVLADQLRAQRQDVDAQPGDRAGLEAFIRAYLSPQHRDQSAADAARTDALSLLGFMIGTLQLARALTDPDLSDQLLTRGVETVLKL